jgi:hypothetical protein
MEPSYPVYQLAFVIDWNIHPTMIIVEIELILSISIYTTSQYGLIDLRLQGYKRTINTLRNNRISRELDFYWLNIISLRLGVPAFFIRTMAYLVNQVLELGSPVTLGLVAVSNLLSEVEVEGLMTTLGAVHLDFISSLYITYYCKVSI